MTNTDYYYIVTTIFLPSTFIFFMKLTILKNFARLSNDSLLAKAEEINSYTTTSSLFTGIYPAVDVFTANLDNYRTKLAAAADGGRVAVAAKNEARKKLVEILKLWASYIEDRADGNESSILATGFELSKKPLPGTSPNMPENVRLSDGKLSGEALVKFKSVPNATTYEIRFRKDGEDTWQAGELTFKASFVLRNILPGTVIWVQVRAVNTHGSSNWSDPATMMVR